MFPIKRILVPTDFSESAARSLAVAVDMATDYKSELVVLHVIEPLPAAPPDPDFTIELAAYQDAVRENADEQLTQLRSGIDGSLSVRTMISHGNAAREIVRIGEEEEIDLIVIATHGLTGLKHLVFGSVAERVVRTACCPVLTLRDAPSTSEPGFPETGA